jgi:probable rRNA maturation factor
MRGIEMIRVDIALHDQGWMKESFESLILKLVDITAFRLGLEDLETELSLVFTNNIEIRHLNYQWRFKDEVTNVLSFPAFPLKVGERPGPMLGDVVLARETLERESLEQGKLFDDHLSYLVLHGFLHLLGYDHETDDDAELMEELEEEILERLLG